MKCNVAIIVAIAAWAFVAASCEGDDDGYYGDDGDEYYGGDSDGEVDGDSDSDSDSRWAASVAAFAEIIEESPFADEEALDAIEDVLLADDSADSDRVEFLELFQTARTFL